MPASILSIITLAVLGSGRIGTLSPLPPWGETGHIMAARAAVEILPPSMPSFVRTAGDRLAWLNPEPDRWRSRDLGAMDQAFSYDHYIDLENVPAGALDAPNRWRFLAALYEAGIERPERDVGFLPYRIEELYQRLLTGFRQWRTTTGPEKAWIEERILNDAGVLGHYVTDGSQPHHTTIHFNGWNASGAQQAPNPEGFSVERDFHARFETGFVRAHVRYEDVRRRMPRRALEIGTPDQVGEAVRAFLLETHDQVPALYRLENTSRFDPEGSATDDQVDFTADRLAAGATLLGALWWSAWLDSARPIPNEGR